ncbi:MAG: ArsR family transcriptional regulator, partial [Candidatus Altiarchaeum hamiconexum]|nr:ArsR family transcriptional regulator [Candidatus Altarchaeum hamiconexum]
SVFGKGTKTKLMIVNTLKNGEMSYSEIQKNFSGTSKSTLYKYLSELYKGGIIKKRVERTDGKRPLAFYILNFLAINLSPSGIKDVIEGKNNENREIFAKTDISVKGKGITQKFSQSRLLNDLLSTGIKIEDAVDVLKELKLSVYEGITTTEIRDMVCKILENNDEKLAEIFAVYIDDKLKVHCGNNIEIWTEDEISHKLRAYRKMTEFTGDELNFLSHKIVRDIKKITLFPSKGLVEEYIKFIANSF